MSASLDDLAGHQLVARRVQELAHDGFKHVVQTLYRSAAGHALLSTRLTLVGRQGPMSDERWVRLTDWPTSAAWVLGLPSRDVVFDTPRSQQVSVLSVPGELRLALEDLAAQGGLEAAAFLAGLGAAPG